VTVGHLPQMGDEMLEDGCRYQDTGRTGRQDGLSCQGC
jgi:hypothetical protein